MRILLAMTMLPVAAVSGAELKPIAGAVTPVGDTSVAVFKTTPQGELKIHLYFPKDWKPADRRPGIVFFFGGGFVSVKPDQFTSTAEYFASRGMVAASSEYRIGNTHHTGPERSAEDAKSAIRWLRLNARSLGIDAGRVVAGGGSAGGTCAAFAAYNTTDEPEGEDTAVSSIPDALVLYNPALGFPADTSKFTPGEMENVKKLGAFLTGWKVVKGGPPAILFFGTEDYLLEGARIFTRQMIEAGNRAELYTAAGQKHGFFNDRGGTPWHALVVRQTDLFLGSLEFLKGLPTKPLPADTQAVLRKETP